MNDAGTVIVADVYAAGEEPIPGVTRDALVDGLRARGHRSVVPLPSPARLAEMVFAIARPGDFVVCLGAGNITQWAAALPAKCGAARPSHRGERGMIAARRGGSTCNPPAPRERRARRRPPPRSRGGGECTMMAAAASLLSSTRCRRCVGACRPTRHWRRSPGSASAARRRRWCGRRMRADLAQFLRALPLEIPVHVIGACSNLIIRDGGLPGVVIRLARGFGAIAVEADGVIAGAAALDVTVAEHAAAAGLTGLEFLSGIPGSIGGAVVMNGGAYGGEIAVVPRLGGDRHAHRRAAAACRGRSRIRLSPFAPAARRRRGARPAARAPRRDRR